MSSLRTLNGRLQHPTPSCYVSYRSPSASSRTSCACSPTDRSPGTSGLSPSRCHPPNVIPISNPCPALRLEFQWAWAQSIHSPAPKLPIYVLNSPSTPPRSTDFPLRLRTAGEHMSRTPSHLLKCPPAHPLIVDPESQISRTLETPRQRRWLRLQRIHLYPRITASQLGASGVRLDGRSRCEFSGKLDHLIGT